MVPTDDNGSNNGNVKRKLVIATAAITTLMQQARSLGLTPETITKAWKDPVYRATLSKEELEMLPPNPAGELKHAPKKHTAIKVEVAGSTSISSCGSTSISSCGSTSISSCGNTSISSCGSTSISSCSSTDIAECAQLGSAQKAADVKIAGSTSYADCGSTSYADCGSTSYADCGSTSYADCGSTSYADCSSTQNDCGQLGVVQKTEAQIAVATNLLDCGNTDIIECGSTELDCAHLGAAEKSVTPDLAGYTQPELGCGPIGLAGTTTLSDCGTTTLSDCGTTTLSDCGTTTLSDCGTTTLSDCSSTQLGECAVMGSADKLIDIKLAGNTGPIDCGNTGPIDCGNTGPIDCGNTGPIDCGNTGPIDCSSTQVGECAVMGSVQKASHILIAGNTAAYDCGNTGLNDCGNTGLNDCGNTGLNDCGNTGLNDCGNTGLNDCSDTQVGKAAAKPATLMVSTRAAFAKYQFHEQSVLVKNLSVEFRLMADNGGMLVNLPGSIPRVVKATGPEFTNVVQWVLNQNQFTLADAVEAHKDVNGKEIGTVVQTLFDRGLVTLA